LNTGTIVARLTDHDQAVVAWWTQLSDTGGGGSGPLAPPVYEAASAGRGGRFAAPVRLDAGAVGPDLAPGDPSYLPLSPRLFAAVAPSGRVRLAWTGADSGGPLARAASIVAGVPGTPQSLGHGTVTGFAADGHDRALVLWGGATGVFASTASAGRPYAGSPEPV